MESLAITHTAVVGSELAIVWSDGIEGYYEFEKLRRSCPCANCQGEPDALGRVIRPSPAYGPKSFVLAGWETVGGYALQFRWADGHSTGIYSFQYLREHVPHTA